MPLVEPTHEPPLGFEALRPGMQRPRPRVGVLDIGALELGDGPPVEPTDGGVIPGDGDGGLDGGTGVTDGGGGCGCRSASTGGAAWPFALALVIGARLRRRFRTSRAAT